MEHSNPKQKIALYFGSFNPIHMGHLLIANYVVSFYNIDELWFVVSPHNPLKNKNELPHIDHRLQMVSLAIKPLELPLQVCDIEKNLAQPSYTINTLQVIKEQYPGIEFSLLMGADNLAFIERWKNARQILTENELLVYPRMGFDTDALCAKYGAKNLKAPIIEISASFIRQAISENKNVNTFTPMQVWQYINDNRLYSDR